MVEAGFTPVETLLCATRENARLIGWQDRVGTLEKGKLADIIALDINPLKDIAGMQKVAAVIKNGEVVR